ncbi:MFS transporter [Pelagibius sp. Alg239-R121]|uniref:MFS transporter n=1 Tax=Pelagibius sp. Alg239-R121 TaxID=2993448 RepID=UPI0024A76CCA|nr:MFS transporter [Pelagibius sp. Alg239-R121]
MQTLNRLTFSAYGMHVADQIALVSVPLVAALIFKASPEFIGVLVACQSMAHLLGSIPSGLIVDEIQAKYVAIAATAISFLGFAGVAVSVYAVSAIWFAVTVTLSGFGIVLFVLVSLSIIPRIAAATQLAKANSRIEIPRAVSSFAIPLAIGLLIDENTARFIFPAAIVCAATAFFFVAGLPHFDGFSRKKENVLRMIIEGGRFVVRHQLLRPISLCAVFWNLAFAALLVVMVPLIVEFYRMDPGVFGIALSAFGVAAVAGSWMAGRLSHRVSPNVILLFGPGSSLLAALALLCIPATGPVEAIYAAFFLVGFGPAMWLITQNSIRQLVTPGHMLGRVNAVIQTAIYGVRPLGALAGGVIVGTLSPRAGMMFVLLAFCCSFAAALFSQLRNVNSYTSLSPRPTPTEI